MDIWLCCLTKRNGTENLSVVKLTLWDGENDEEDGDDAEDDDDAVDDDDDDEEGLWSQHDSHLALPALGTDVRPAGVWWLSLQHPAGSDGDLQGQARRAVLPAVRASGRLHQGEICHQPARCVVSSTICWSYPA